MLAAEPFELIFRILHVMAGVAWAGAAFLFTVYIEPAATRLGPGAGPMMEELFERRKIGVAIVIISGVTVLAGWALWLRDLDKTGDLGDWVGSAFGLWLTIGGVAATAAFFVGMLGIPPNVKRLSELGKQVAASGGPPTPDQATRMHAIQEQLRMLSRLDLALLTLAVFAMATARYW